MKPQGMGSLPIVYGRKIWGNIMEVYVKDSFRMNSSVLFPELFGKGAYFFYVDKILAIAPLKTT